MRRSIAVFVVPAVACVLLGSAVVTAAEPISAQRTVGGEWARYIGEGNQRAACEMQTLKDIKGMPCGELPTLHTLKCPAVRIGAKPPYRKSEIRTVSEQVGEFTEESPTRGFVVINAQVKASKMRGALGLEQVEGVWRVVYLRHGSETFVPAGEIYGSEAWHKLWVSDWCPVAHPQWEKKEKKK
jgi:hypothetical protein